MNSLRNKNSASTKKPTFSSTNSTNNRSYYYPEEEQQGRGEGTGAASKIQEMIRNSTSRDDDEVNTYTTNTSIHQAKNDLMQLGIELDDELIERLQKNLGIDKIFKVAHDAVHVIKSTTRANKETEETSHPFDVYGQRLDYPTEMSFRHVPNTSSITKIGGGNEMISSKKKRKHDISSIFTLHQKSSIVLLKQLENRDDHIEPQYRPMIDQLIEYLRLLYIRSPKKFLYRLLNKKLLSSEEKKILFAKKKKSTTNTTSSTASTVDAWGGAGGGGSTSQQTLGGGGLAEDEEVQLMYKWILQSRYFNYTEFAEMLNRILPPNHHFSPPPSSSSAYLANSMTSSSSVNNLPPPPQQNEIFKTFFLLICDEKRFETSQKKKVVDLWNFLTLLKISSEESRRSYDNQKSKLANDVEFWKRDNNIKYLKQSIIVTQQQSKATQPQNYDPLEPNLRSSWMTTTPGNAGKPDNTIQDKKFHRKKNPITNLHEEGNTTTQYSDMATVLGQHRYENKGQKHQGRNIYGTYQQEVMNSCDIPMALHHNPPPPASPSSSSATVTTNNNKSPSNKNHKLFQQAHDLPIHPLNDDVFDSSKVSYLLGDEKKRKEIVLKYSNQPPPPPAFLPQTRQEIVANLYNTHQERLDRLVAIIEK